MADTIKLPRSGVELERHAPVEVWYAEPGGGLWLSIECLSDDWWRAHFGRERLERGNSRDECIAWLDARVLELRRALLPEGLRERVAAVIQRCIESPPNKHETSFAHDVADAVFAEIGA